MVTPSYLAAPARLARSPEAPSTGSPLPPMGLRQHEMQRLLADRRARALSQLPPQAPTLLLSSPPGTLPACSGPAEFQPRKSLTPFSRICGQQCSRASPSLPIHPPPPEAWASPDRWATPRLSRPHQHDHLFLSVLVTVLFLLDVGTDGPLQKQASCWLVSCPLPRPD